MHIMDIFDLIYKLIDSNISAEYFIINETGEDSYLEQCYNKDDSSEI